MQRNRLLTSPIICNMEMKGELKFKIIIKEKDSLFKVYKVKIMMLA